MAEIEGEITVFTQVERNAVGLFVKKVSSTRFMLSQRLKQADQNSATSATLNSSPSSKPRTRPIWLFPANTDVFRMFVRRRCFFGFSVFPILTYSKCKNQKGNFQLTAKHAPSTLFIKINKNYSTVSDCSLKPQLLSIMSLKSIANHHSISVTALNTHSLGTEVEIVCFGEFSSQGRQAYRV